MIPMRSATTSSSAAFAPSSRRNQTAPRRSATTSGFIVSATASSGCSVISRSTAPSPHDDFLQQVAEDGQGQMQMAEEVVFLSADLLMQRHYHPGLGGGPADEFAPHLHQPTTPVEQIGAFV